MKRLTAAEIATALGGELYGIDPETPLTAGVVTDSREVGPGDIYVARRGESFDGIEFAAAAVEAGSPDHRRIRPTIDDEPLPVVVVADATEALGQLAKHSIEGLRTDGELTVIAITGSVGKTTVKDLAADLLSGEAETVWPPNSYNNEVGVPLTALRAVESTRFLVLEMGLGRSATSPI